MTTPPSSLPPANWYPDPQTPGQLRYWDGQRWTQHVHPAQQPAQGVGGAATSPLQAGPGVFLPAGRPGGTPTGQGPGTEQGTFAPTQAGPATGAQPLYQPESAAAGPATGSHPTFQPVGAGGRATLDVDVDSIPHGPSASTSSDSSEATGTSKQALLAIVFGFLALAVTSASVYGLGTDFDVYLTYAAGGIGFLAVLFGFSGVAKASQGEDGRFLSFLAITLGFLAIGVGTYEYLYPHELYDMIAGLF